MFGKNEVAAEFKDQVKTIGLGFEQCTAAGKTRADMKKYLMAGIATLPELECSEKELDELLMLVSLIRRMIEYCCSAKLRFLYQIPRKGPTQNDEVDYVALMNKMLR